MSEFDRAFIADANTDEEIKARLQHPGEISLARVRSNRAGVLSQNGPDAPWDTAADEDEPQRPSPFDDQRRLDFERYRGLMSGKSLKEVLGGEKVRRGRPPGSKDLHKRSRLRRVSV